MRQKHLQVYFLLSVLVTLLWPSRAHAMRVQQIFSDPAIGSITGAGSNAEVKKIVVVSPYGFGTIALLSRDPDSGVLSLVSSLIGEQTGNSGTWNKLSGGNCVAVSPNGRFVVTGDYNNGSLDVYAIDEASLALSFVQEIKNTTFPLNGVNVLAFSSDGQFLYTDAYDGLGVYRQDDTTGLLSGIDFATNMGVSDLAISADEERVFWQPRVDSLQWYERDIQAGSLTQQHDTNLGGGQSLAVSQDGKNLYTVSQAYNLIYRYDLDVTTGIPTNVSPASLLLYSTGNEPLQDPVRVIMGSRGRRVFVALNSKPPPNNSIIPAVSVFQRDASGSLSHFKNLIIDAYADFAPGWNVNLFAAPNQEQLIYVANNQIYTIDTSDSAPEALQANNDIYNIDAGETLSLNLLENDVFTPASIRSVIYRRDFENSAPDGTTRLENANYAEDSFILQITPPAGYIGVFNFDYQITNIYGESSTATVTVNVWATGLTNYDDSVDYYPVSDDNNEQGDAPPYDLGTGPKYTLPDGVPDVVVHVCDSPSLSECRDPSYPDSACGQTAVGQQACLDLLVADAQNIMDAAGLSSHSETDVQGQTQEVFATPFRADTLLVTGMYPLNTGRVARDGLAQMLTDAAKREALEAQHQAWQTNCGVYECDEYIYEKYYDYENLEKDIAALRDNYRGIYERIYNDADAVAYAVLQQFDGSPSAQINWSDAQELQNAFFASFDQDLPDPQMDNLLNLLYAPFPDGRSASNYPGIPPLFDWSDKILTTGANLREHLQAQRRHYVHNWDFHQQASQALNPSADPDRDRELYARADEQTQFLNLLQQRRHALDEIWGADMLISMAQHELPMQNNPVLEEMRKRIAAASGLADDTMMLETEAELIERSDTIAEQRVRLMQALFDLFDVENEMFSALQQAEAQGCLDDSDYTVCDWSPRMLAQEISGRFAELREADYQRCILRTGNDFRRVVSTTWLMEQEANLHFCDGVEHCVVRASHAKSVRHLEEYFDDLYYWQKALALPIDPVTGQPSMVRSFSDRGKKSGGPFFAEYNLAAFWRVSNFDQEICDTDFYSSSTLSADIGAYSYSTADLGVHLFETDLVVHAHQNENQQAKTDGFFSVEFLGVDLFTPKQASGNAHFSIFYQPSKRVTLVSDSMIFFVLGFPVVVEGGVTGAVGVDAELSAEVQACRADGLGLNLVSQAKIEPYARIDAYASASVSAVVASAGVRSDLNIIKLALPFNAHLNADIGQEAANLRTDSNLKLTLDMLSGSVSLFVEIPRKTYRRTIFSWSGVGVSAELFSTEDSYPLDVLSNAVRSDANLIGSEPSDFDPVDTVQLMCNEHCLDGEQNSGELGIDCGGTCVNPCAVCEQGDNLLRNPGFEPQDGSASGNVLPVEWLAEAGRETNSFDNYGVYGLHPSMSGLFRGLQALGGRVFVAGHGWQNSRIAQALSTPLQSGQQYHLSAYLLQPVASDFNMASSYDVHLASSLALDDDVLLGTLEATSNPNDAHPWEARAISFTAPANAAALDYLIFVSREGGAGLDELSLRSQVECAQ